jgi:UDP-glucuronate 4-epimerase
MNILITGTAGFIGFHLSKKLLEAGNEVTGADNINDYYDVRLKYARLNELGIQKEEIEYGKFVTSKKYPKFSFIKVNMEDREEIDRLFATNNFDTVCHLAAQAGVRYSLQNPYTYINSNIVGFLNVIEASQRHSIKHFVYASSSSVYGLNEDMPFSVDHNVDHPMSLYAATKKSAELIAHTYSHIYNLPVTGLRFFTVYGPWGRPDMALYIFTKKIFENQEIELFNNGNMLRDFTYIDDIIKGIIYVIHKPAESDPNWSPKNPNPGSSSAPYKIYNIGNNHPVKLTEFVDAIEQTIGKKAKKIFLPEQKGDILETYANIDNLIHDFNYKPDTPVSYGIKKFVEWYKGYYEI